MGDPDPDSAHCFPQESNQLRQKAYFDEKSRGLNIIINRSDDRTAQERVLLPAGYFFNKFFSF